MVIALDMFFMIENPQAFLQELHRILKLDSILVIDDGHQSRKKTIKKLIDSGLWEIVEERKDCLMCMKI
jgi:ubiquinone/menaquinone biosynthesis C-methylase UbiE